MYQKQRTLQMLKDYDHNCGRKCLHTHSSRDLATQADVTNESLRVAYNAHAMRPRNWHTKKRIKVVQKTRKRMHESNEIMQKSNSRQSRIELKIT